MRAREMSAGFGRKLEEARKELDGATRPPRMHPLIAGIAVAALVFAVAVVCEYVLHQTSQSAVKEMVHGHLKRLARAAGSLVDPDLHQELQFRSKEGSAEYRRAIAPLQRLQDSDPEIAFVYTCVQQKGIVYFVLDPTPAGDSDGDGVDDKSHIMEPYPEAPAEMKAAFGLKLATADIKPYRDRWGEFISGYAPIKDDKGRMIGIAGVDLSAANYKRRLDAINAAYTDAIWITALLALISGLLAGAAQAKSLALHRDAEQRDNRYKKQIANTFERVESAIRIAEVSRNRFSDLFEGIPVACLTFDQDCRVFEWNSQATRLFRMEKRGAMDNDVLATLGPIVFGEKQADLVQKVLTGESFSGEVWSDGSRHLQFSGHPLIGSDGAISGGILAAVDITRQKDAEDRVQIQLADLNRAHRELNETNRALQTLNAKLEELATTDALTGLPNRRAFYDVLHASLAEASRGKGFALVQADIDYFKLFNDVYGHHAGDKVLMLFGKALKDAVRPGDFVARHGGEEFYILLRGASRAQATRITERIRHDVAQIKSGYGHVTASFGIALWHDGIKTDDELMQLTDNALYDAKNQGRNRIVVNEEPPRLAA